MTLLKKFLAMMRWASTSHWYKRVVQWAAYISGCAKLKCGERQDVHRVREEHFRTQLVQLLADHALKDNSLVGEKHLAGRVQLEKLKPVAVRSWSLALRT